MDNINAPQTRKDLYDYNLGYFFLIVVLYLIIGRPIISAIGIAVSLSEPMALYIHGVLRILIAMPCILALRKILQAHGLETTFMLGGLKKGLFAHAFLILVIALFILAFFYIAEINVEFIPIIPSIVFFEIGTGLFEEALFRGLLLTALLIQYGATAKGRISCVLVNGILFGALHLFNSIYHFNILTFLLVSVMGVCFAAAYTYSKNLLACMFFHMLWNVVIKIGNGLVAELYQPSIAAQLDVLVNILFFVMIPLFAIIITIKSKPLYIATEPDTAV